MARMRTPESDDTQGTETQSGEGGDTADTGGGDASLLADGFGGSDAYENGFRGGDNAFGAGSTDDTGFDDAFASNGPSFLQDDTSGYDGFDDFADSRGDELSAFEFESDDVADGDDNLDFNGDGTTDGHDAHAFVHGLHSFHDDLDDPHTHVNHGLLEP